MKIVKLKQLIKDHGGEVSFVGACHDCGVDVEVIAKQAGEDVQIAGGAVYDPYAMEYTAPDKEQKIFVKCDSCYGKDSALRNYQDCQIWSRIVGYMRPLDQWNDGKMAEFKDRKNFKLTSAAA
jgi:hypothetical protein